MAKKFILVDANVVAAYYLPRSLRNKVALPYIENIFEFVRQNPNDYMIYIPNFCIAEVVSVFIKYSFAKWNIKETINTKVYNSLIQSFQNDIHNAKFMYHLELDRYHILGINLVAPIDHYFQIYRTPQKKKNYKPAGTFDQLLISMGIQLSKIHGRENVCILTADHRLAKIVEKCRSDIRENTLKKIKISIAEKLCSTKFSKEIFPFCINLSRTKIKDTEIAEFFGACPLKVKKRKSVYRWLD
ncbi:MAG: hypothetical protein VKL60_10960 [Sphaerospermopsis sp.]|nr:hypothetical protein [Sphaerospermopsis sp.]